MYTVQFYSNLSRHGITRQVAEKIAQCNRTLGLELFTFGHKKLHNYRQF